MLSRLKLYGLISRIHFLQEFDDERRISFRGELHVPVDVVGQGIAVKAFLSDVARRCRDYGPLPLQVRAHTVTRAICNSPPIECFSTSQRIHTNTEVPHRHLLNCSYDSVP